MTNKEKNVKYANLIDKMDKAIEEEFYFEAILIQYAIIEDRTESMLRHANLMTVDEMGNDLTLNVKIKTIRNNAKFIDPYIKKHLTNDLFKSINEWRIDRNRVIHSLVTESYTNNEIKRLALEGKRIIKILNNKSTLINKHLDKKKKA
jgi:hypothetical protein